MYLKKEKNRYFEWYKKLVYAGPKSARTRPRLATLIRRPGHCADMTAVHGSQMISQGLDKYD